VLPEEDSAAVTKLILSGLVVYFGELGATVCLSAEFFEKTQRTLRACAPTLTCRWRAHSSTGVGGAEGKRERQEREERERENRKTS